MTEVGIELLGQLKTKKNPFFLQAYMENYEKNAKKSQKSGGRRMGVL